LLRAKINATQSTREVARRFPSNGSRDPVPDHALELIAAPIVRRFPPRTWKRFLSRNCPSPHLRYPSQELREAPLDYAPGGRIERRLPIIVVVRLAHSEPAATDGEERTFTDNISPSGARIFSKYFWQPGELVRITPLNQEGTCGKVVYCQTLSDDRYCVGVKFQARPVTWSALQRHNELLG
jgi:hypothetical protein